MPKYILQVLTIIVFSINGIMIQPSYAFTLKHEYHISSEIISPYTDPTFFSVYVLNYVVQSIIVMFSMLGIIAMRAGINELKIHYV